jgi:hypothetical protein
MSAARSVAVFVVSPLGSNTKRQAAQRGLSGNRADIRACYSIVTE